MRTGQQSGGLDRANYTLGLRSQTDRIWEKFGSVNSPWSNKSLNIFFITETSVHTVRASHSSSLNLSVPRNGESPGSHHSRNAPFSFNRFVVAINRARPTFDSIAIPTV